MQGFQVTHLTDQHLKDEDAETPPVYRPRVRRLSQHLWGEELGRTTERAGTIAVTHTLLTQPEVCYLNKPLLVQ